MALPVYTASGRRLTTSVEYLLVAGGVPAWLALASRLPLLDQMPGVVVLVVVVMAAFYLRRGPALLAVAIGAVGHELIRTAVPMLVHVERVGIILVVGAGAVALAAGREAGLVAAQRYRALFERHPLPMAVFDEQTLKFLSVNDASIRTYGYTEEEFLQMTVRDIRPPEAMALIDSRPWIGRDEMVLTTKHRTKDGTLLDVLVRSQSVPYQGRQARLVLVENITEQRELEAQLRQAQKMEAIGQLAGGVAHDFNNLLTAIRGYAALLLDALPAPDPRRDDVLEIERAGVRATALTGQLLAFSRKQILQERVVGVAEVVDDIVPMLGRLMGENVRLRTLNRARGHVRVDPSQLQQVLMNLVVNARDAVADDGTGEVTIETDDVVLDELYARSHATAREGPHVVVAVSDNGAGMSSEVQARAFDPFFTTKPTGHGTGLGLSTVYGIVKQSGGHVWLYSEVGRGTTVKVYLQRVDAETPAPTMTTPDLPHSDRAASILLVEDEDGVRSLLTKVLTRAGYVVQAAATPDEARTLVTAPGAVFDLLITDVILSHESGRLVAEFVAQAQPACRTLFISGYTDDAVVRKGILSEQMPFLQKPFSAAALLEKVSAVLSSRAD